MNEAAEDRLGCARPRVELLAPAGGPPALQAALSAGADAGYVGLDRWSARAFAGNFGPDELLAAVDRAHLFGARLHLALNVSLKDDELEPALTALAEPCAVGLDALIVADLGFAGLVREAYPDLELHASTQLDTHSSVQLATLARLGFARAILARELSLDEVGALESHGLALEAFVHGALCYGYSGACLLSSMASGRSGNRGRCSQACRMRYRLQVEPAAGGGTYASDDPLVADDSTPPGVGASVVGDRPVQGILSEASVDVDETSRVLSTADLAAIAALPGLIAAGVTSFKIEGRMKDAAYVAVTTAVYREALDAAVADPEGFIVQPSWLSRLEQSFSRGFTTAHLDGRHAAVRGGGRGGHRGVLVGRVETADEDSGEVVVRLGAGVELHDDDVLQVYTVWGTTEPARLSTLRRGARAVREDRRIVLRLRERVGPKDRVFRTASGEIGQFAADAIAARALARPVPLSATLSGAAGERPRLALRGDGEEVTVEGEAPLAQARTAALTPDKARRALGALGGTPYELVELDFRVEAGVFLAVGQLKELRRRAVGELDERRLARRRRAPAAPAAATAPPGLSRKAPGADRGANVEVRRPEPPQKPSVVLRLRPDQEPVDWDVDAVCFDLRVSDDPVAIREAATRARERGVGVRVRSPEILFDADAAWARAVGALHWDTVYARHPAALEWSGSVLLEYPLAGLNALAARRLAPAGVVASPELSLVELGRFVAVLNGATEGVGQRRGPEVTSTERALELLVFGREQVLVSRDTLGDAEGVAAFPMIATKPVTGATSSSCGGVLRATLTDTKGFVFPALIAPGETRLFNARVTNLCRSLDELVTAGATGFIVEQRDLTPAEREAFVRDRLTGLGRFDRGTRFTTGHLYRGVG